MKKLYCLIWLCFPVYMVYPKPAPTDSIQNDILRADTFVRYADQLLHTGNIEKAHEYFYKAINIYDKLKNDNEVAVVFMTIANSYIQLRDHDSLAGVISIIQQLSNSNSPALRYVMYNIRGAYYYLLYEASPERKEYRDSALFYMKKSVALHETSTVPLFDQIENWWTYYNIAFIYLKDFDSPMLDSVQYYMNKAETQADIGIMTENAYRDLMVNINDMKAWLHYHRGDYVAAEREMTGVLNMLNTYPSSNMVVSEYGEAYRFFAMLYEQMGRPVQALKYQKLFNEKQRERFNQEKMYALKELNIKYEVDKKEHYISELQLKKIQTQRILILTVLVSGAMLLVAIMALVSLRLKRKNREQELYEKALIAEQRLDLPDITVESQECKGRQNSIEIVVNKLHTLIESSSIDNAAAKKHIKALTSCDTVMLEQTFASLADKLTRMDIRYILCFYIGMEVSDIATLFNVEPASIYAVRYRIRKKFKNDDSLLALI